MMRRERLMIPLALLSLSQAPEREGLHGDGKRVHPKGFNLILATFQGLRIFSAIYSEPERERGDGVGAEISNTK